MLSIDEVHRVKAQLLSFCACHEKIFLYGAGFRGNKLHSILHEAGIKVNGFIITKGTRGELYNVPILPVNDVLLGTDSGVIIAFQGADMEDIRRRIGKHVDILHFPDYPDEIFTYLTQMIYAERTINGLGLSPCGKMQNVHTWKNILIIRLDVIGDLVMTTPLVREIRQNCPDSHITLIVDKRNEMLFRYCPYISDIVLYEAAKEDESNLTEETVFELQGKAINFVQMNMRTREYDVGFLPRRALSGRHSIEEFLLLCAIHPKAIVSRTNLFYLENTFGCCFLFANMFSQIISRFFSEFFSFLYIEEGETHEVKYMLDMITACGCLITDEKMELWVGEEEERYAEELVKSSTGAFLIAVGLVGRGTPRKNWPTAKFQEVIDCILEKYGDKITFVLFGGDDASLAARSILKELPHRRGQIIDVTGKTDLAQSVAIMKRCCLYVGAETGVKHMAAAVGLPVVELSYALPDSNIHSDSEPRRFGAWGVPRIVLKPPKGLDDCKGCCCKNYPHCITQILVEDVIGAVESFLHNIVA